MKANYIIRVGETLTLSLLLIEGDIDLVSGVSAVLKPAGPNGSIPATTTPAVATFQVSPVDLPDIGWDLYLSDEVTALIKPGLYITNAKLDMINGEVLKTDAVLIDIRGSVV